MSRSPSNSTSPTFVIFRRARLCAWIFVATFAGGVRAESSTSLFAFGDSYSDSGAGYVDGNGPTAIAYLARELGIPFTHANDPERKNKGLNFAVSGAKTGEGEGRRIKDSLLGRGMKNQVADFIGRVKRGEIEFDPGRTVFFLAGGLNDRRVPTADTIANLEDEMRQLHAVGARHFLVALLPTKIRSFADVGIRLNPALAAIQLDMSARKNLYLIFKEAVNNAIKYSDCTELRIALERERSTVVLRIQDDGKGFDQAAAPSKSGGGNGLPNMQKRAAELGAMLTITSAPGQGTLVELRFAPGARPESLEAMRPRDERTV